MKYLLFVSAPANSNVFLRHYCSLSNVHNYSISLPQRSLTQKYWLLLSGPNSYKLRSFKKQYGLRPPFLRPPLWLAHTLLPYSLYFNFTLQKNLWVYLQQLIQIPISPECRTSSHRFSVFYLKVFKHQLTLL